jgi:hypothetical protein
MDAEDFIDVVSNTAENSFILPTQQQQRFHRHQQNHQHHHHSQQEQQRCRSLDRLEVMAGIRESAFQPVLPTKPSSTR